MTFGESIQTCFSKYADFTGRASRSEYWWWALFTLLLYAGAAIISDILYGLVAIGLLLPSIAVGVRRLHDIDKSGWFLLVALIPFVGWLIAIYWAVQEPKEPNRF